VNIAKFQDAIRQVIESHEIFRTRLQTIPGFRIPVQEMSDLHTDLVFRHGARVENEMDTESLFRTIVNARERQSLLEITFHPYSQSRHLVALRASPFIADAQTLRNIVYEAASEYNGYDARTAPIIQYGDYSEWRNDLETDENDLSCEARAFWNENVNRDLASARLTAYDRMPRNAEYWPMAAPVHLSDDVWRRLCQRAESEGVEVSSLLTACWAAMLHRYTALSEIPIGITTSGRIGPELAGSMGPYAQVVPLWQHVNSSWQLSRLAQSYSNNSGLASVWQNYFCWPAKIEDASPFCAFGFAFDSETRSVCFDSIRLRIVAENAVTDRFTLQLQFLQTVSGVIAQLVYDPQIFSAEQATGFVRRFELLCSAAPESWSTPIGRLPVITPADRRFLLLRGNCDHRRLDEAQPGGIHRSFEKQAELTPDRVAAVYSSTTLTYRELNQRANRLAHRLRTMGVKPEMTIGILLGRCIHLPVAILGILKAGAAYVALDSTSGAKERLGHILAETNTRIIVTRRAAAYDLDRQLQVIFIDDDPSLHSCSDENPADLARAGNLAYVLYTSGSSGFPKGVMIRHLALMNLWAALKREIYRDPSPEPLRATLNAPISFDSSVKQILLLLGGHTLHIIPEELRVDPHAFVSYLRENDINVLDCTPSYIRRLLEADLLECPDYSPRIALIGGETIDPVLWWRLGQSRMHCYNVYGPTECTVDATIERIAPMSECPSIGAPLDNVNTYVLDEDMELQPVGIPGILYIGGRGVARGYYGQPALTAERFVPSPFDETGERLYCTGDLVRMLPNRKLEYLGREDNQMKLRGFRIEPGEITAALYKDENVVDATVLLHHGDLEHPQLIAYVVPRLKSGLRPDQLRASLSDRIPEYMLPNVIIFLDELPVNTSGKIDHLLLEELTPSYTLSSQHNSPPSTPTESWLTQTWASVLNVENVGVCDNFFQLGGHSLSAMQVVARVRKHFSIDVPFAQLFQKPTIAALAKIIDEAICATSCQ